MHPAIENLIKSGRVERGMWWEKAWRLVEGCTKVSPGCLNCWSETQCNIRSHNPKMINQYPPEVLTNGKWSGDVKFLSQNLDIPLKRKKPTVFAVWNDLFHIGVAWGCYEFLFKKIRESPQHIFIILTKRPELAKLVMKSRDSIYKNIWLGVTAENQEQADKRIPILLQIPAAKRFVSVEPMLSEVDLDKWLFCEECNESPSQYGKGVREDELSSSAGGKPWTSCYSCYDNKYPKLDWVICGTESLGNKPGRTFPRHIEAISKLKDQCVDADVQFFLKQVNLNGKLIKMPELDGKVWNQFPTTN